MINYSNREGHNFYTTGFQTSKSAPMTLKFEAGTFHLKKEKTVFNEIEGGFSIVDTSELFNYPSFELDIESDNEFDVLYDIYLLEESKPDGVNIHVDRTELGIDTVASYTGKEKLLHCLSSFVVPPNTTDISDIAITINTIELKEETPDEN